MPAAAVRVHDHNFAGFTLGHDSCTTEKQSHCDESDAVPIRVGAECNDFVSNQSSRVDECNDYSDQSITIHTTLKSANPEDKMMGFGEQADLSLNIDIVFEWATTGKLVNEPEPSNPFEGFPQASYAVKALKLMKQSGVPGFMQLGGCKMESLVLWQLRILMTQSQGSKEEQEEPLALVILWNVLEAFLHEVDIPGSPANPNHAVRMRYIEDSISHQQPVVRIQEVMDLGSFLAAGNQISSSTSGSTITGAVVVDDLDRVNASDTLNPSDTGNSVDTAGAKTNPDTGNSVDTAGAKTNPSDIGNSVDTAGAKTNPSDIGNSVDTAGAKTNPDGFIYETATHYEWRVHRLGPAPHYTGSRNSLSGPHLSLLSMLTGRGSQAHVAASLLQQSSHYQIASAPSCTAKYDREIMENAALARNIPALDTTQKCVRDAIRIHVEELHQQNARITRKQLTFADIKHLRSFKLFLADMWTNYKHEFKDLTSNIIAIDRICKRYEIRMKNTAHYYKMKVIEAGVAAVAAENEGAPPAPPANDSSLLPAVCDDILTTASARVLPPSPTAHGWFYLPPSQMAHGGATVKLNLHPLALKRAASPLLTRHSPPSDEDWLRRLPPQGIHQNLQLDPTTLAPHLRPDEPEYWLRRLPPLGIHQNLQFDPINLTPLRSEPAALSLQLHHPTPALQPLQPTLQQGAHHKHLASPAILNRASPQESDSVDPLLLTTLRCGRGRRQRLIYDASKEC
ncbi:hypothetical protein CEUSTIGMA_g14002.t1, partial [Chlamydomonas eustigma]